MTEKTLNQLDREAAGLYKELNSVERFSKEYIAILKKVIKWTEQYNRPLFCTYDD